MIKARGAAKPAFAVACGLLLVTELLLPQPGPQPPRRLPLSAVAPDADDQGGRARLAAMILARPLFNAGRRPAAVQTAVTASQPMPRLSAIVITGGRRSAIFTDSGGQPQVVGVGGEISTYRVQTITPNAVKLSGPDGLLTLYPQFTAAAGSGSGTASVVPPPAPGPAVTPGPPASAANTVTPKRLDDDPI